MKYPYRHHYRRFNGFTLSEVIVLIAIIGVLSAIAAPSVNQFLLKARLEQGLLRLQGALRETQNEAIRRNQSCNIIISPGVSQIVSGNCLVTGNRPLQGIQVSHNRSGGQQPWTITFDARGRNQSFNDSGTTVLSIPGQPTLAPKCLVLSVGIGLHRIGDYEGEISNRPVGRYCITTKLL